jgi:hypothetical protein
VIAVEDLAVLNNVGLDDEIRKGERVKIVVRRR